MDSIIESYAKADGTIISDKDLAPLALGQFSYGVTLWEMTAGYTMFQNEGIYSESRLWYKVLDSDGNAILENEPEYEIAISEEAASIMTLMMQDVITNGTGAGITLDNKVNVAGKTGTTTADFDRWFIGYTPYFVGGVWTGYDMNQSLSDFGENPSLQIWDKVMTMLHEDIINDAAKNGEALKTFKKSEKLIEATYCKDSGMLIADACKLDPEGNRAEKAYFTKDTLPTEYCTTHVLVAFDKTTNRVATPSCPKETLVYKGLRNVDRCFPIQLKVVDSQYTCNIKFDPLTMNYPTSDYFTYYYYAVPDGYTGISNVEKQYNAICLKHPHK
jgi:penicillin-binding protein 1A